MTNLENFTPDKHTDDLRPDVLLADHYWGDEFKLNLNKIVLMFSIGMIGLWVSLGIRYGSYNYQALLKHQVDMVKAHNKPFVELAKRAGE